MDAPVADPSATPDAAPAAPVDDLAILAEIQAADQAETPDESDVEDVAEGEHEGNESSAGPPKPVKAKAEPEETEPEDKPKADDSPDVKRARAILASANKKLARAQFLGKKDREAIVEGLRTKPHETLRSLGLSIGQVLDADPEARADEPAAKTADERLAAIEAREQAQAAKEEQARNDAQIADLRGKIVTAIKADTDFARINRTESHDLVIETMVEYFKEHGQPLPSKLAAKQVEEYLAQLAGEPNISPAPGATRNATPPQKRQGSVTLGNNDTRNVPPGPDDLPQDADARHAAVMKQMGLGR